MCLLLITSLRNMLSSRGAGKTSTQGSRPTDTRLVFGIQILILVHCEICKPFVLLHIFVLFLTLRTFPFGIDEQSLRPTILIRGQAQGFKLLIRLRIQFTIQAPKQHGRKGLRPEPEQERAERTSQQHIVCCGHARQCDVASHCSMKRRNAAKVAQVCDAAFQRLARGAVDGC